MIDAHCHLEHMPQEVIEESKRKGMTALIASTADINEAKKNLASSEKYPDFVFSCLGFHPEVMGKYSDEQIDEYADFIRKNKDRIKAIGEIGLDYNWITKEEEQERSRKIFEKFIDLAMELDIPMVVHSRNGRDDDTANKDGIGDALKMLAEKKAEKVMLHCFSGSEGNLKFALKQGWIISFATIICKSFKHQRLANITPIGQMVIETDSPWLDPETSERTNRPWKVEKGAETIADKKGITKDEVIEKTTENARKFFGI